MLEELHIKNLALIEDNNIDFTSPYIALVGETGAGKTLIVDSLSILKGGKFDTSLIRDKNLKTSVAAFFNLDDNFIKNHQEVIDFVDGKSLLIKRVINADNTSKYYINDEIVTAGKYKEVTSHLIDIHSQGENSSLLNENNHLFYLDQFAIKDISKIKKEYCDLYLKYQEDIKELNKLIEDNKDIDEEYLNYQIKEIKKYDLKENEIEDLLAEEKTLKNFESISESYNQYQSIKNNNSLSLDDLLSRLIINLKKFKDTSLDEESKKINESINNLLDSLDDFENKFKSLDFDPKRIDYVNERLFNLKGLMRKYGNSTNDILKKLKEFENSLEKSSDFETIKKDMSIKIEADKNKCIAKAKELSIIRKNSALKLEKELSNIMVSLGLKVGGFKIDFTDCELSVNGIDKVKFLVCLNEGMPFASLVNASSGGENSRLMLALKCVLNALDPYQLLIFDEIDTGVSGKIAYLVGKKIKELSSSSQIIVISHLPQVISSSISCYEVTKTSKDNVTISKIKLLEPELKVEAVAKLLSSSKVTDEARLQAKKLIDEFK